MFCNSCGKQIPDDANLCPYCARSLAGAAPVRAPLVRPRKGRRIAGVCLGLAQHFGWNVTALRILWLVLLIFAGVGLIPYVILWVVMPNEA